MENYTITNNEKEHRFETLVDGELAILEYRFYKGDIAMMHTFVPEKLGSKGVASALAKFALEHAKTNKLPVMVYCPFVGAFLKKHPEYNVLLDKKYTH